MAKVNGKELNSEFLAKIDAKINELYNDQGDTMVSDLSEFIVNGEKKYILKGNKFYYEQLNALKKILNFSETDELGVFTFRTVTFKREDEKKFKDVINSCRFLRDEFVRELLDFNSVGYLPGYNGNVYAPLPQLNGQSIQDYEKYLKEYYASFNITVGIDEKTGVRKPYPHELCQWENGVPRQCEKNYRNAYYRDFVEKFGNKDLDNEEEKDDSNIYNDVDDAAEVSVNRSSNATSSNNENTEQVVTQNTNGRAKKAKFRVKERKSFGSLGSRFGNFLMEAPDKLRNFDRALGSDNFWHGASKIIKRAGLIVLGGGLAVGAVALLGSQFIGSFATPGWAALGTGTGSSLAVLPLVGQIALSVAPIIGVTTLVAGYMILRKRYVKRRESNRILEEKPDLSQVVQQEGPSLAETINNNVTHDNNQNVEHTNTNPVVTPSVEPSIEQTTNAPKPASPVIISEPQVLPEANYNFEQDPFLQLDSLIGMIKKDRQYISELNDRRITVESNGSPDASGVLNDIENQAKMLNEQVKGNMVNIAQLCMNYNKNFSDGLELNEGGMKL